MHDTLTVIMNNCWETISVIDKSFRPGGGLEIKVTDENIGVFRDWFEKVTESLKNVVGVHKHYVITTNRMGNTFLFNGAWPSEITMTHNGIYVKLESDAQSCINNTDILKLKASMIEK